jgi:hypothetical protein
MTLPTLTPAVAGRFAARALANLGRDYPHKLDHVLASDADVVAPRQLHPAFHGSFDWHSCVHMHWLLARIRRGFPRLQCTAAIDAVLDRNLAPAAVAGEVAYLRRADTASFERPYGWAWLLKLAAELRGDAHRGAPWSAALQPLADAFAARFVEFLPRARYPVRHGVHANSALGLAFALDYAHAAADRALARACLDQARRWYADDTDLPCEWEPSGADFLSPALVEANLMRRVLAAPAFAAWLAAALPGFDAATPAALFTPVIVDDRSDPQLVHLDGLNLARAWCLREIAASLPENDARAAVARRAADAHLVAGWQGLASDAFVGSHWLATFAMLALDA